MCDTAELTTFVKNDLSLSLSLSSPSILIAIFPGETGLADFIVAKDDRSGGDNNSYKMCKAPVKQSPPTTLPVAQPTVSKHWTERKNDILQNIMYELCALIIRGSHEA